MSRPSMSSRRSSFVGGTGSRHPARRPMNMQRRADMSRNEVVRLSFPEVLRRRYNPKVINLKGAKRGQERQVARGVSEAMHGVVRSVTGDARRCQGVLPRAMIGVVRGRRAKGASSNGKRTYRHLQSLDLRNADTSASHNGWRTPP